MRQQKKNNTDWTTLIQATSKQKIWEVVRINNNGGIRLLAWKKPNVELVASVDMNFDEFTDLCDLIIKIKSEEKKGE